MRNIFACLFIAFVLAFCALAAAEDWPHLRGPRCDGIVTESPALVGQFPDDGPKKLWSSQSLFAKGNVGYGSVTVADGKAYAFANPVYDVTLDHRLLTADTLRNTGYDANMPADTSQKVEVARVSDERAKLKGKELNDWIGKWLKDNIPDEQKGFRGAAQRRLQQGANAMSLDLAAKLAPVVDRRFDNEAALQAWFAETALSDEEKKKVIGMFIVREKRSHDFLICMNALAGEEIWRTEIPSYWMWYPGSSTPTIANNKVYVLSSESRIVCLDAANGAQLWKTDPFDRDGNRHNRSSSVLVIDGAAIAVSSAGTLGANADTGEKLWEDKNIRSEYTSAIPWTCDGKTCAVINGSGKVTCISAKDGKTIWSVKGGDGANPTISGDIMVIATGKELIGYKLNGGEEPKQLWSAEFVDSFTCPLVIDGYVYAIGEAYSKPNGGRAICVDANTGELKWQEILGPAQHSSPLLVDGKIVAINGGELLMFAPTSEKFLALDRANLGLDKWASPAAADGRLYLRTPGNVICVDVRKNQ